MMKQNEEKESKRKLNSVNFLIRKTWAPQKDEIKWKFVIIFGLFNCSINCGDNSWFLSVSFIHILCVIITNVSIYSIATWLCCLLFFFVWYIFIAFVASVFYYFIPEKKVAPYLAVRICCFVLIYFQISSESASLK